MYRSRPAARVSARWAAFLGSSAASSTATRFNRSLAIWSSSHGVASWALWPNSTRSPGASSGGAVTAEASPSVDGLYTKASVGSYPAYLDKPEFCADAIAANKTFKLPNPNYYLP